MYAFVFDVDDTFYDRLEPFRAAYRKHFSDRWDFPPRSVYRAFARYGQEVFEDSMNQKISMREMYLYRTQNAMRDFGVSISEAEALDFQKTYEWHQHHLHFSPGMEETLNYCQGRGLFLGVITNGLSDHQRDKSKALGLERWIPPEHFLASGDIGINKPDPEIFRIAAGRWQLSPEETFFIGDSYENDIAGAKLAGWRTIWLDKAGAYSPQHSAADVVVRGGAELLEYIRQLTADPENRHEGR